MFVCSYNLKLNKFNSPRFNVCPILGYNIDASRVSDIFFRKNGVAATRVFYHPTWLEVVFLED